MINIKSFRIGSHVSVDGKRVRVCGITRRKIGYHHPDERPDAHLRYARIHDVEPIPLTTALLEELGFEWRKGSDSWLRYENLSEDGCDWGIIASEYGFDGWWQIMFRPRDSRLRNEVCCKYLHQLESILALHGVELIKE